MPAPSYTFTLSNPIPTGWPGSFQSELSPISPDSPMEGTYYNPRLDPKNYLHGPLSPNPATRLRQMLARPGIVVRPFLRFFVTYL